jgi:hypothetical protein
MPTVVLAAFRGGKGGLALFALNCGGVEKMIEVGGLGSRESVTTKVWNRDGGGRVADLGVLRTDANGRLAIPLAPWSMTLLKQ